MNVIAFKIDNRKDFEASHNELLTRAQMEDTLIAIFPQFGLVLVERLSIEMGEIFDKYGYVLDVPDYPVQSGL